MIMHHAHVCPAEHEVLPVSEGHRVTLTYNLRALHKTKAELLTAGMTSQDATELAAVEQTVASDNAAEAQDGSTAWMTAADVSASAELAAELQAAMADKTWHPEGEGLSSVVVCPGMSVSMVAGS
jgi:hypothetical protein